MAKTVNRKKTISEVLLGLGFSVEETIDMVSDILLWGWR